MGLLRSEARHADEEHVVGSEAEGGAQCRALGRVGVARAFEGDAVDAVVDTSHPFLAHPTVLAKEAADVIGEHDGAPRQARNQAVDQGDQGTPEHLLIVVLAGDQARAPPVQGRRQGRKAVGLEQMRVDHIGPGQVRRERARSKGQPADAPDMLGAGGAKVLRQTPLALQVAHA